MTLNMCEVYCTEFLIGPTNSAQKLPPSVSHNFKHGDSLG